jgi:parallel beta-helix repeat protein
VGGTTPAARNVLSGNDDSGIFLINSNVNRIQGNYIGTDKGGTKDLGNTDGGVFIINPVDNEVGGATAGSRNLISGNDAEGVGIINGSRGTQVLGNRIGTTANGTGALGNADDGVFVSSSSENFVGDLSPGAANIIAFNGGDGVIVSGGASNRNSITSNSIFSNTEQGIDLVDDGPTANDPGDADTGANSLQNKPVVTSAKTTSTATTVKAKLNSTPNRAFRVQFFSNPSGNEGKKFVGQQVVSTDASGNATFTFKPAAKVAVGQMITATASADDTSEFSAPRKVVAS